jgi:hypothetical protein
MDLAPLQQNKYGIDWFGDWMKDSVTDKLSEWLN